MLHSDCRYNLPVTINAPHDLNFHGKTGIIEKVNPINVKVRLNDNGRIVNIPPLYLTTESVPPYGATVTSVPIAEYVPPLSMGTVVRVKDIPKIQGIYIVAGGSRSRGGNDTKIVLLGGDGGRYWTVPASSLEVVSLEDLAHELRTLLKVDA